MGKKKRSKKKQRDAAKAAAQAGDWIARKNINTDDLILAGLGVAAQSATKKSKRKRFKNSMKTGRRLLKADVPAIADLARNQSSTKPKPDPASSNGSEASEPVISYRHNGGGWYVVEVAGVEIDRVQGEQPAAERAGSLLAAYAALDSKSQQARATGVDHVGGGWYEVKVSGVPIDRIRGKDAVAERYPQLVS